LIQSVGEAVPYPIAHPVTEGKVAYLKCLRDVEMESTLSLYIDSDSEWAGINLKMY
jgi:hypothetical protein